MHVPRLWKWVVALLASFFQFQELWARRKMRAMTGGAFAGGHGFMQELLPPLPAFPEIVVTGVTGFLLGLRPQLPPLDRVASFASILEGSMEEDRPEDERGFPVARAHPVPSGVGVRKEVYPDGLSGGLDDVQTGLERYLDPRENISLHRSDPFPVRDDRALGSVSFPVCENLDLILVRQGQVGGKKDDRASRGCCQPRRGEQDYKEDDERPSATVHRDCSSLDSFQTKGSGRQLRPVF